MYRMELGNRDILSIPNRILFILSMIERKGPGPRGPGLDGLAPR